MSSSRRRREVKNAKRRKARAIRRNNHLPFSLSRPTVSSKQVTYEEYIHSPAWTKKRREAFAFYGRRCSVCGTSKNLHVHHKTYERMCYELMNDLEVICKLHHDTLRHPDRFVKDDLWREYAAIVG